MIKTYKERELWVMNNEQLYNAYIASKQPISKFIKENKDDLDDFIMRELGEK